MIQSDNNGFKIIKSEYIEEISSQAFFYEHIKTRARLVYLKNDDDNKVFSVSFSTPPTDSCGTPHIIEHSVLCGSEKYPLKDPFVRLLKSSLSTFLNAMTFADKTMYPVASRNEQDFRNLIDVYCDAVFFPLITKSPYAFMQEGWHYEYDEKNDSLDVNGIVYNEMKGVFSDAEELIMRESADTLYPDTSYSNESGGLPEQIPALSYEKYLDFYKTHYHPSNSYIFVYGNTDINECLKNLNERYLSRFEPIEHLPEIKFQDVNKLKTFYKEIKYDSNEIEGKYYFTANYRICSYENLFTKHAFTVLMKILFDTDSSVLKLALTEAKIAQEVDCDFIQSVKEPYFTIIAKNANEDKLELFINTINNTLEAVIKNGIDQDTIKASLNNYEFNLREADSGNYPKGLIYNIDMMESWLYGSDPFVSLKYSEYIKDLRDNETSDFYTSLIKKLLIDNSHKTIVKLIPQKDYSKQKQLILKEKLNIYKSSLNDTELNRIIKNTDNLKHLQKEEDSDENIAKMPFLKPKEIDKKPSDLKLNITQKAESKICIYTDSCSDIVYFDIDFDIPYNDRKTLAILQLLTKLIGIYPTEHYSEYELGNTTGIFLGDTDVNIMAHQDYRDINKYKRKFVFSLKALFENAQKMFELSTEMLTSTKTDDPQRLYITVTEEISKFESYLGNSAESLVAHRILNRASQRGAFIEAVKGLNWYYFLLDVKQRIENGDYSITEEIRQTLYDIVSTYHAQVLITCDEKNAAKMREYASQFLETLPDKKHEKNIHIIEKSKINEGIVIPGDVCYDGIGYNTKLAGYDVPYAMFVLRKYLRTTYLWDNIRVKGGAYGAIMGLERGGDIYFISYRDPNIASTYHVYDNILPHINMKSFSQREINDLIVGTISDIDPVLPVYNRGRKALYDIYRNDPYLERCAFREGVLSCSEKQLKDCAQIISNVLSEANKCCAASLDRLEDNKVLFDRIRDIKRD